MRDRVAENFVTLGRAYVRRAPGTILKGSASRLLNPWLRDHPRRRVVEAQFGTRFAVDTQDLIQRYVYLFGAWEPHLTRWLERTLRPRDAFIDVGANVGYMSLLAAMLVGRTGRVVAVEASPAFHERVLQHVRLNGCTNVRGVNAAVSDKPETLHFTLASSRNMGANSALPYDGVVESSFEARALPLPELLIEDELTRARVIKVDVEGAEGRVFRGLAPALPQLRQDAEIVIEVTPDRMERMGDSIAELLDTARSHGFHAYRLPTAYDPETYPPAISRPQPPTRWRGPIVGETELVLSRRDVAAL